MKPTFLQEADQLPPIKCFMLARNDRKPILLQEIAASCGWSDEKVGRIANLTTWRDVSVGDMDRFMIACGINRANMRRQRAYLKRTLDLDKTTSGLAHFRKRSSAVQNRVVKVLRKVNNRSN